ncbi:hypothetical protein B1759_15010 [Rubrivirga sp. SAORIC476]|uniref:terminase large subunit n=1 Tax=Rubrivirga sp. SAORIC476 TaxID=1961794 RepID=UPI000BA9BE7D|nr:terminase TerL endonuclease subunit [Rubrivirga sp. SAORIC476]PAP79627.1 hypothetical protein B1759_15010 [Rubrivirga sp. SAORIC476]
MAERDYAAIARGYAEDVVAGDTLACRLVIQACQRHLDNLDRQQEDGYPFVFDPDAAARVCGFVELMPHTKGEWARRRETIVLEPWQVFIVASVFGWLRKADGLRRFRTAYIEVARKNGKSALSSPVGLYMLAADGEEGAEVFCGATTEKQAKIVFDVASQMAKRTPSYREAFGVEVFASNISVPATSSKFETVIGKPGDGDSPHLAIIDEYHEHASDEQYDTMLTGMGAREQPLMWIITTAGSDSAGPCYALRSDAVSMLQGTVQDDELFAVIYTLDGPVKDADGTETPGDDWTDPKVWIKANPNLGVSVKPSFIAARVREAVNSARKQNVVKTKHCNVWVSAATSWMNMEAWNRQADAPPIESHEGEPCWIGLDLASKVDVASAVKVFRRDVDGVEHIDLYGKHYLPEARVEDPDRRHYQGWAADGHLIATDGDIIDHQLIQDDLEADAEAYRVVTLGYDPWNATDLAVRLEQSGIDTLEVRQTVAYLSDAMKWFEALVLGGRLHHDGNPAMSWMVENVIAKSDPNDNVFPRKATADKKIDGAVAAIIALYVARRGGVESKSVYEERGLREL